MPNAIGPIIPNFSPDYIFIKTGNLAMLAIDNTGKLWYSASAVAGSELSWSAIIGLDNKDTYLPITSADFISNNLIAFSCHRGLFSMDLTSGTILPILTTKYCPPGTTLKGDKCISCPEPVQVPAIVMPDCSIM